MNVTLSDAEIVNDLEFHDMSLRETTEGTGYAIKWRRIGVGFIELLRRPHKKLPPTVKETYDKNVGRWSNTGHFQGYFDTKEAAAIQVVRHYLEKNSGHDIVKAMLSKDYDFIEKWNIELSQKFKIEIVEDEKIPKKRKKRDA